MSSEACDLTDQGDRHKSISVSLSTFIDDETSTSALASDEC